MKLENLPGMKPIGEMSDEELDQLIRGTRANRVKTKKERQPKAPKPKKPLDISALSAEEQDALLAKLLEQKEGLANDND